MQILLSLKGVIMKYLTFVSFVALALFVGFAGVSIAEEKAGAVTKGEVKKETAEALNKAGEYAAMKKDEYIKKMKAYYADLSKKIDVLKEKGKVAQGDAAEKINSALAELKVKQEEAKKKLGELGKDTSSAWSAMKSGFDKAMGELKKAYDKAAEKVK
jgi:hypothetical protein